MTEEPPLIPRTIYADPSGGRYWSLAGALFALVGIMVGTTTGALDIGKVFFSALFTCVGGATFLVNYRMTKNGLPSITLTPEGIYYYSIFFDREYREWRHLGRFYTGKRPDRTWDYFSRLTSRFRQLVIIAQDETYKRPLVPPPPGYTGDKYDKEIWISIRRFPMYEDAAALDAFVDELNAWRDRYGSGECLPCADQ